MLLKFRLRKTFLKTSHSDDDTRYILRYVIYMCVYTYIRETYPPKTSTSFRIDSCGVERNRKYKISTQHFILCKYVH